MVARPDRRGSGGVGRRHRALWGVGPSREPTRMIPAFYPVLDTAVSLPAVVAAEAILEAGARILQFRHKGIFSRQIFEEATNIASLCRGAGALFVINDRADIA